MKKTITGLGVLSLVVSTLLFSGCGSDECTSNADISKPFRNYATDSDQWMRVETLFGPDPAIASELSVAHGTGALFRTIYKSPLDAMTVDGLYPEGTMFLKELRLDDNGKPGRLAGSTTVMIKRNGMWTYIKLNPELSTIEAMGTASKNETGSVTGCVICQPFLVQSTKRHF